MAKNPFEGLKRRRLPFVFIPDACDGGMNLHDALASFFFVMLHDKVEHNCLIKETLEEPSSGPIGSTDLVGQEFSYLEHEDVSVFYLMANAAIEQVQRWIAEGSHEPFSLPKLGGEIVTRPQWAKDYFGSPDSETRSEARKFIQRLLAEVEKDSSNS